MSIGVIQLARFDISARRSLSKTTVSYCERINTPEMHSDDIDEMKSALSAYLNVLYTQNAQSVGGKLPDDAFYYSSEE